MNTILTLQDVARAREFYQRGYWQTDTLYMLLRAWAEATPGAFRASRHQRSADVQ